MCRRECSGESQARMQCDQCQYPILTAGCCTQASYSFCMRIYRCCQHTIVREGYYLIRSYTVNEKLFSVSHWKSASVTLPDFEILTSPADVIVPYLK